MKYISNAAVDLNVWIPGVKHYYVQTPTVQKYKLVHQTVNPALTDTNRDRLNLGVGEEVWLGFFPEYWSFSPAVPVNPTWTTTAGGLMAGLPPSGQTSWPDGAGNTYYNAEDFVAPSNAANVTIIATVAGQTLKEKFKVFEPSGVDTIHTYIKATNHIGTGYPDAPYEFASGRAGAEMLVNLYIAPTSVSFYRVQILEVGLDATNVTGYFTNYPAEYLVHEPNTNFTFLLADNSWQDKCWEGPEQPPPPAWSSGSYKWIIPAKWSLSPSTVTNSMTGWDQVFTIDSNGTVKITKYGKWVQRTTSGIITNN